MYKVLFIEKFEMLNFYQQKERLPSTCSSLSYFLCYLQIKCRKHCRFMNTQFN